MEFLTESFWLALKLMTGGLLIAAALFVMLTPFYLLGRWIALRVRRARRKTWLAEIQNSINNARG